MAQIGSYVPAKKARLGLHDAVLTRMGGESMLLVLVPMQFQLKKRRCLTNVGMLASDELTRGRSTFMVEISETSDILKICTPRSLVILDERAQSTARWFM